MKLKPFLLLAFLIFFGFVCLQPFINHARQSWNICYNEWAIFGQISNPPTNLITNEPNRNSDDPKKFMSQDAKWAAVFMIIGALLAGIVGLIQNWWIARINAREEMLSVIEEARLTFEMKGLKPDSVYKLRHREITLAVLKFRRNIFCCNRRKLNREWKAYKQLEHDHEEITKGEIERFWNFCYEMASCSCS
jgi:hypothetical protein